MGHAHLARVVSQFLKQLGILRIPVIAQLQLRINEIIQLPVPSSSGGPFRPFSLVIWSDLEIITQGRLHAFQNVGGEMC